ncbi:MAG: hypothetical protein ABIY48_11635 [Acidimicrobiales bacterium]
MPVKDNLALTSSLVAQLAEQGGYEAMFVLDNGSIDGTAAWLAAHAREYGIVPVAAEGMCLHRMWNLGVALARAEQLECNVAILNNDLRIGARFLGGLSDALRADERLWAVCPTYDERRIEGVAHVVSTFKRRGLAGFAFMVRGEAFDRLRFEERLTWWYGDDDLVAQIYAQGRRVGIVGGVEVDHVNGGSQTLRMTPAVEAAIERDRQVMVAKWNHD